MVTAFKFVMLPLLGGGLIMSLSPLLSYVWHALPVSCGSSLGPFALSRWVFLPASLALVGIVIGVAEEHRGWALAVLAALPAVLIPCHLLQWQPSALGVAAFQVMVAGVAALIGSRARSWLAEAAEHRRGKTSGAK